MYRTRKASWAFLAIAACIGCERASPPVIQAQAVQVAEAEPPQEIAIEPIPEQPKVAVPDEFQLKLKEFCSEAASVARSMSKLIPDKRSLTRRIDNLDEIFSRIPEPESDSKIRSAQYQFANLISVEFRLGPAWLQLIDDGISLESESLAEGSRKGFRDFAKQIRASVDELASASSEGRLPKEVRVESINPPAEPEKVAEPQQKPRAEPENPLNISGVEAKPIPLDPAEVKAAKAKAAASKLKLAKQLLKSKKKTEGRKRLSALIDEFPETPAATEAAKILGRMDDSDE